MRQNYLVYRSLWPGQWLRVFIAGIFAAMCLPGNISGQTPHLSKASDGPQAGLNYPIVITQLPSASQMEPQGPIAEGMLSGRFGEGARIIIVYPDKSRKILTNDFQSACDPSVSFDGKKILFSGKKSGVDRWDIYEMDLETGQARQITHNLGDCRSPSYQSTLYTIISTKPWYQITFVAAEKGAINELGEGAARNLYSCKLDGSSVRRLTYNLSSDFDPFIMYDGRLLFSSWQRATLEHGPLGFIRLCGINIDGADFSLFAGNGGKRIKSMACVTTKGIVVFVEADKVPWDGSGSLGSVTIRRPLHSYRPITQEGEGFFLSPSPLPDGRILASRRSEDGSDTHAVCILDPVTAKYKIIFDDPDYHDIQAQAVTARQEPDGRSSVVTEKDPNGKLYCLNIYLNDLEEKWLPHGTVQHLRVIEGLPVKNSVPAKPDRKIATCHIPLAPRRILGEIPIQEDGSFNIEIPASIPIELQILDENGMALRTCSWIWAKNHEPRGCIGCHEDSELTPENHLVKAVTMPAIKLTLPPQRRRTVTFKKDIQPILEQKCVSCHRRDGRKLRLFPGKADTNYANLVRYPPGRPDKGTFVSPGRARVSKLIWHVFGNNTSRPWDNIISLRDIAPMPPATAQPLSKDEKRTMVEWIDLGAMWDKPPIANKTNDNKQAGVEN